MKPQSNLFRIFAVGLALLLVGAYVFDRSGGDLKAAVGLDRVFGRDAQVEALNQRIERLEGKLDLLLNASGIPVNASGIYGGTPADVVGDPFAGSPPTAGPTPPTAAPSPTYLHSTKSAAVFEPSQLQPTVSTGNTGTPRTAAPELMLGPKSAPVFTPAPTPPTAAPTNTGNVYDPRPPAQYQQPPPRPPNAPADPPRPTVLPGSKSMGVFTPQTFTGPPVPPAQQVQQQKGHQSLR